MLFPSAKLGCVQAIGGGGFREVLRKAGISNAVDGVFGVRSLAQWRDLLNGTLPDTAKFEDFHVKASDVSFSMERSAEVKRWYSHSKALARGRRQQKEAQDAWFHEYGPLFLETVFRSERAVHRMREAGLDRVEQAESKRKRAKKVKGAGRQSISVPELPQLSRGTQAKQIAKYGVRSGSLIVKDGGRLELKPLSDITDEDSKKVKGGKHCSG